MNDWLGVRLCEAEKGQREKTYWVFVPGVVLPSYCWSPIDSWLPSTSDHRHDLSERSWHSEYINLALSLYHAPLHNIRMMKHQVSCFRMHSDLKGAVHWRMYVVIIYFYLVTGQIRFYCHYFVCETHTKKLAERPCYESAWWPRLLSSWKDGKSAPCDSWTIFETFWSLWWLYLMNRLNFSSWFTKKLSALVFVYILHVLCKLRENRWWQFSL